MIGLSSILQQYIITWYLQFFFWFEIDYELAIQIEICLLNL